MIDIDELNDKFCIEEEVAFSEIEEGMPCINISNKYAEADICLYGAQITSYKPYRTMDILWMSPDSFFEKGKAIRGGIPICFPWFGPHKSDSSKPQHGFARLMFWDVVEVSSQPTGGTIVRLQLCSSSETKTYWDFDFCAELQFVIGKKLEVSFKVTNTSSETFEYTSALHSYFNISSIEEIAIVGLKDTRYQNQLDSGDYIQKEENLEIHKPTTHHYYNTESPCVIIDPYFGRRIQIEKSNSRCTTVWNPWEETCKEIVDMPDDAYQTFVCVETVNSINDEIRVAPGEAYETIAVIGLEDVE